MAARCSDKKWTIVIARFQLWLKPGVITGQHQRRTAHMIVCVDLEIETILMTEAKQALCRIVGDLAISKVVDLLQKAEEAVQCNHFLPMQPSADEVYLCTCTIGTTPVCICKKNNVQAYTCNIYKFKLFNLKSNNTGLLCAQ